MTRMILRIRAGHAAPLVLLVGCGLYWGCAAHRPPGPPTPRPSLKRYPPSNLRVEYMPQGIILTWQTNRQAGDLMSGYNIYLSPEMSIQGRSASSPEVIKCQWLGMTYPGDTDLRTDVEQAEIPDVEYGVKYFVHVRKVYADQTISEPSEEITVVPRPFGRFRLVPRFSGEGEGYSFAAQKYVATQDERNDLYLFVRSDSVFAASPHRLDRYLRYTEFFTVGPSSSIDDFPTWDVSSKGQTSVHLQPGWTYILSTPETCLAKFRVAEIQGSGERLAAVVDFVYQRRCGEGVF